MCFEYSSFLQGSTGSPPNIRFKTTFFGGIPIPINLIFTKQYEADRGHREESIVPPLASS